MFPYVFTANSNQKSGRPNLGRNEVFSWLGKSRFLDGKGGFRRVRVYVFGVGRTERPPGPRSTRAALKKVIPTVAGRRAERRELLRVRAKVTT
jgi:hypothetical protein